MGHSITICQSFHNQSYYPFQLDIYPYTFCHIWNIVELTWWTNTFPSLVLKGRHPILMRLWESTRNFVEECLLKLWFVLDLKLTLWSTSIMGPCPLELPILPIEATFFNLLSMHHKTRNVHLFMNHNSPTFLHKIIRRACQKMAYFISRITHQRRSIIGQQDEFQRLLLNIHTSLKKVDEFFHLCLSNLSWEKTIMKYPPKDFPTY